MGTDSSSSSRTPRHERSRFLKSGNREVPTYSGKVIQESFEGIAGFDVIEQILQRYSGSTKNRCAVHDRWIA